MMAVAVRLDTRVLDEIARNLNRRTDEVGMEMAFKVEARTKPNYPYQTGALQNSVYVASKQTNVPPSPVGGEERVAHPTPTGKVIARVGPCVVYGARIEFGFHGADSLGRMYNQAARPALVPAFEAVCNDYMDGGAWRKVVGMR